MNKSKAEVTLFGIVAGISAAAAVLLAADLSGEERYCNRTYQKWEQLQETILDCMEHPACYITPDTLMQVRTLAPQVAECERREYDK